MKKIFKSVFILSILSLMISCDDYLDVNEDPNNPQISELNPDNLLSAAQSTTATTLNTTMNQLGNIMTANWSANATDFSSPFDQEFRYDLTSNFYTGIWSGLNLRTANFSVIENYNDGQNWDNHIAIAKILKSYYYQYLVDLYGDIPYTDLHAGVNNLFPTYDDDKDIYMALYDELDAAIALINNTNTSTVKPASASDIIYAGDMDQWVRFANTVKLRILIRQTKLGQQDGTVQTYLDAKFLELQNSGAQFITENATLNPGYLNSDNKQNPFYANYAFDAAGNPNSSRNLVGPSEYVADFLNGDLPAYPVADPRVTSIYQARSTTNPTIIGVAQGASTGRPSRLGPGLIKSSEQDLYIFTASESYFLQAEAAFLGYNIGGSAQSHFNSGINKSFETLGLTTIESNNYIANSDAIDGLGWNGSVDKLEAIIMQKWIALNGINGIETWIEYNRTGFPANLPLPLTTSEMDRPNRLLYPSSEYSGNSNNVPNQVASDAFTTKVFWDVN